MVNGDLVYGHIIKVNGREFGRTHYRLVPITYIYDDILTLINNRLITISVINSRYQLHDSIKYNTFIDSIFSSVKIVSKD